METLKTRSILFLSLFVFFVFAGGTLFCQTYNGTWQPDGDDCNDWNIRYGLGKVGINIAIGSGTYRPNLLLHSFACPADSLHPAVFRLQTESINNRDNYFGQSRIEFWSNEYEDEYQWMVGKIESFNEASENAILDSSNYTDFHGGLKFYCSGGPSFGEASTPIEVMRLVDGKVKIMRDWELFPFNAFDINSGMSISADLNDYLPEDLCSSSNLNKIDYSISFFLNHYTDSVSNQEFHIDLRGKYYCYDFPQKIGVYPRGLNFSYSSMKKSMGGYCLPVTHEDHDDEENVKGISDIMTLLGAEKFADGENTRHHGKTVCIGCTPYRKYGDSAITDYGSDVGSLDVDSYKWCPAGPLAMLTVSDQPFPFWYDGDWELFEGNDVILRLERRDVSESDTSYKLISAGHLDSESFIVFGDGNVFINGDLDITGKIDFTDFTIDHWKESDDYGLKTEGRVTIGPDSLKTSSTYYDDYSLSVYGILVTTELVVNDSSAEWYDYVFDDDYELMPLEELDKSIKENGHLPDIPTTEEVAAKGINVGKMQAKLLQKIEELTLYVIDLKKENKAMQKQIDALKKQ